MITIDDFFDLSALDESFQGLFEGIDSDIWKILSRLETHLANLFPKKAAILGQVDSGAYLVNSDSIYIGPGTRVEAGAYIAGPAYIGANCQVRHGAYVRGPVIAGDNCVLGHASEFKNALLLPGSHAGHFAYVGDSILGHRVNLGAGTKLSNLGVLSDKSKADVGQRPTIKIPIPGATERADTGLTKLGAILGDDVQTGCNAVLNPGCLVGRETLIYANVSLAKGYWAAGKIIKLRQQLDVVELRNDKH